MAEFTVELNHEISQFGATETVTTPSRSDACPPRGGGGGWGTPDFKWRGWSIRGKSQNPKKSLGLPTKPKKLPGPNINPQKIPCRISEP